MKQIKKIPIHHNHPLVLFPMLSARQYKVYDKARDAVHESESTSYLLRALLGSKLSDHKKNKQDTSSI